MFAEHFQFSAGTRHYFKRSYEPLRLTLLQAWCQRGVLISLPTSPLGCLSTACLFSRLQPLHQSHCRGSAADATLHRHIWHRKANTLLVTDLTVIVIPFSANRIICSDPARPQRPQQKKNRDAFLMQLLKDGVLCVSHTSNRLLFLFLRDLRSNRTKFNKSVLMLANEPAKMGHRHLYASNKGCKQPFCMCVRVYVLTKSSSRKVIFLWCNSIIFH